jgi:hypothetical protein
MFKKLAVIFAILCLPLALASQETAPPAATNPDAPSKEQVLELLDLIHQRANMTQMLEGVKQSMKVGAEAGFRQKIPNPTPDQLRKVDDLVDTIFQDYPFNDMIEAIVPIYQRHLTKTDIDQVVVFYSSPVGQKLLKEQPTMVSEAMQAGQQIMLKRIPEMSQRLDRQIADLAATETSKPKSTQPPARKPLPGDRME